MDRKNFIASFTIVLCLILCGNFTCVYSAPISNKPIEQSELVAKKTQTIKQTQPRKKNSKYKKYFSYDKWYYVKKWLPLYVIVLAVLLIYFLEHKDKDLKRRLEDANKLIDKYEDELGYNYENQKERQKVGTEFERYIARIYKRKQYAVKLNGFINGFNDEGIDLIATKEDEPVELIQCKNWAKHRIIHENHIFKLYGAGEYYRLAKNIDDIKLVFYATCSISDQAKNIGKKLNIEIHDNFKILSKKE